MEGSRPAAIVIALDTLQGLQAARILNAREIPVYAVAGDPQHAACRTNVCRQIVFADTRSDDLVPALMRLSETLPQNPLLLPCHDDSVRVVAENRHRLAADFAVSLPDAGIVETLADKERFHSYAVERGFAVPATVVLRSRADAVHAAKRISYPAVLKPSFRSSTWNRSTPCKAYKLSNAAELLAVYDRCREWAPTLLAQQWIEGNDSDLYACNCYFSAGTRLLAAFVTRKLRQWPPVMGSSCCGEEVRDDEVLETTTRFFSTFADYRGLAYLEMKRDSRTGRLFVIEPNVGRPTGRSALAEAAGVELLLTMYCDALSLPLPSARTQSYAGVRWLDVRHDLQAAFYYLRRDELTFAELIESWRRCKAHAVFSWRDPAPFLWDIKRAIAKARSRRRQLSRSLARAHATGVVKGSSR